MKKNKQIAKQNSFTEFLLYTTPNGKVKVEIFLRDETVWLTQEKIAKKAQQMLDLHKELQATSTDTDKHNSLKREIEKLDREIDEQIYKLYSLTPEEIEVVSNS